MQWNVEGAGHVRTTMLLTLSLLIAGCTAPGAAPVPTAPEEPVAPPLAPMEQEDTRVSSDENSELGTLTSLTTEGVSPHLELVDDDTVRIFYSSITAGGLVVAECTLDFECQTSAVLQRMSDLTVVTTGSGDRRGYWVEMNPESGNKEIYTGLVSQDGTSLSDSRSLGYSDEGQMGWGVPDAVTLPDGRVRLYWVVSGEGRAQEKIVSATSIDSSGTTFTQDDGFRLTGGYVDFEVLDASEAIWVAVMSTSPENLPDTAQGIFVATSPDGLEWSTSGVSISPDTASYLDPTGIKNADGSFTLVLAVAPNEMGMRDYDLQHTQLSVIIP